MPNIQNNLTREVEDYFANRQRKLDSFAQVWPVRIASSRTRDLSDIAGPKAGTLQFHLVCAFRRDSKSLCGQSVHTFRLGQNFYTTDLAAIHSGIARHIGICHMEVINV
jgi:hypothetical protein